jgi:hypothetical protein
VSEEDLRTLINGIGAVVMATLIVVTFARMLIRLLRHLSFDPSRTPRALWRDLALYSGLMVLVLVPAIVGAFGADVNQSTPWNLIRVLIGIAILGIFLVYEVAVVGKRPQDHEEQFAALSAQIREGTDASREAEKAANQTNEKIADLNERLIEQGDRAAEARK